MIRSGRTPPAPGKLIVLLLGPAVCGAVTVLPHPAGFAEPAWRLTGVAAWMVLWWLAEAVPLPVTALLPVFIMPLLGIAGQKQIAACYGHPLIFLFLGGFMIAAAIQRWGLHKRISLSIIAQTGTRPSGIIAGFMLATAFLSMWISNTAAAIMLYAVALSVTDFVHRHTADPRQSSAFAKALMLGIAFAASIGGTATLIGTPPNMLFASFIAKSTGRAVSFRAWFVFGITFSALLLPFTWVLLTRVLYRTHTMELNADPGHIRKELLSLGPMSRPERAVTAVFCAAVLFWLTRGWIVSLTGIAFSDTTIALSAACLLFTLPQSVDRRKCVMDWKCAQEIPWGILLLFGGGIALAEAFQLTGLTDAVGAAVGALAGVPPVVLVTAITLATAILTQVTSNTAISAALLPLMGAVALGTGHDPMLLCLPVALASSMAFVMPVATPPNAIVFAYEGLTIRDMARAGAIVNSAAVMLIIIMIFLLGPLILGYSLS